MARLGLLLLALAALLPGVASAQIRSADTFGPHPFGVLLGDVLDLTTVVTVDASFKLDRSTLPQPGPITYSLELRSIDVKEEAAENDGLRYRIHTQYQTFYSALETRQELIPAYSVAVTDGTKRQQREVGKWGYITSPLRPINAVSGESDQKMQPDVKPALPLVGHARNRLIAAAAATAFLLILLAWQRAWPPFHKRPGRPFASAARDVGKLASDGEEGRRAALLRLHRAFDVAWGKRLLGDDLSNFLSERPAFARHAEAIRAFFDVSRGAFFGRPSGGATLEGDALKRLARDLASAERAS